MTHTAVRAATAFVIALVLGGGSLATAPAAHAADRDCGDFNSQRDAQIFFLNNGGPQSDPHRLDSDGDGVACESNSGPYYYGTTPPSGGGGGGEPAPAPEPQITTVRSVVRMTLSPVRRIAGEAFRLDVSVRPTISRDVVVQRKVDGRWRTFGTGTTGRNGVTHGTFKAPAKSRVFRAVLQPLTRGTTRYSGATSLARTLEVQRQQVVLTIADRAIGEGDRVDAVVRATPVRAGRPVAVQVWAGTGWRTVRTGSVDRDGRARFTLAPALGRSAFRAVVLQHRGAAQHSSASVAVVASDRTASPAPYGLVALADNATVRLSWSRVIPDDFAYHEVWMRTDDTPWTAAYTTYADSFAIENLQFGVAYSFTVTSVDTSGNRSTSAEVATVTLEEPVEPAPRVG